MSVRQIIVMRKDLNMRKGKMVAQGSHASMAVLLNSGTINNRDAEGTLHKEKKFFHLALEGSLEEWITGLFTKICTSVDSEAELQEIMLKAKEAGLLSALITDCGATEFGGVPTVTCCAIGPAAQEDVQPITGHLKLL